MEIQIIKVRSLEDFYKVFSAIFSTSHDYTKENTENVKNNKNDELYNLEFFIRKFAEKHEEDYNKAKQWLEKLEQLYPIAAFNIILREIAIEFDKKYSNHINESKEIYVISTLDGRIHKVNKTDIRNYRNFSAFRTLEDARLACEILKSKLKAMYAKK